MNIEKQDGELRVFLEDRKIVYDLKEWSDEQSFLTSEGVKKLEGWKIDLMRNYGVEIDEL